jgi:predicted O-methyltransferase YrrM
MNLAVDFARRAPGSDAERKLTMNGVLLEILNTGHSKTANGRGKVRVHSAISQSKGRFLQEIVRKLDPTVSLEVGLAYGISALFICDALNIRKGTQHIAIDPNQHEGPWGDPWDGIGIANLRRAGFGEIVRLIEAPSYRALAELERTGQRIDFAFVDGWHTFDFALVDLFFIDRILNVGGVLVFDDAEWQAIKKVCGFLSANLAYIPLGVGGSGAELLSKPSIRKGAERRIARCGTLPSKAPCPKGIPDYAGTCIAFQKAADDSRKWNHFVDF